MKIKICILQLSSDLRLFCLDCSQSLLFSFLRSPLNIYHLSEVCVCSAHVAYNLQDIANYHLREPTTTMFTLLCVRYENAHGARPFICKTKIKMSNSGLEWITTNFFCGFYTFRFRKKFHYK